MPDYNCNFYSIFFGVYQLSDILLTPKRRLVASHQSETVESLFSCISKHRAVLQFEIGQQEGETGVSGTDGDCSDVSHLSGLSWK